LRSGKNGTSLAASDFQMNGGTWTLGNVESVVMWISLSPSFWMTMKRSDEMVVSFEYIQVEAARKLGQ